MLRCVFGDASVTTPLIHHRDFLDHVPQKSIERARFRPRRPLGGEMFLVRMLHQGIFRWDELFLVPDNSAACDVRAAVNVNTALSRAQEVTLARPAHTILIDNWSVLHGRSPVPTHAMNRRIERAYFTGASDGY